jgi:hypothetical protein
VHGRAWTLRCILLVCRVEHGDGDVHVCRRDHWRQNLLHEQVLPAWLVAYKVEHGPEHIRALGYRSDIRSFGDIAGKDLYYITHIDAFSRPTSNTVIAIVCRRDTGETQRRLCSSRQARYAQYAVACGL